MAIPTQAERRLMKAGATKGANWGTAVALGANDELLVNSISGLARAQDYEPAKEADTPFIRCGHLGPIKPIDFTISHDLRYDPGAIGLLIADLFGTAANAGNGGAANIYSHNLEWANTQANLFATVCAEYPGKVYEVASAKVMEWGVKVSGGTMEGELKLRGDTLIDSSNTNGANQMANVSFGFGRCNRIRFTEASVKINAENGNDAANETALVVNSLEVSYKRSGHDSVHVAGSESIVEPVEGAHPDVRVKLGFPRFDSTNANYLATFIAETPQKMLISFTGDVIAANISYSLKMFFPRMRIVGVTPTWEEIIKNGLEFVAEEAANAPTGMNYTRPYLTLINQQSANYLA